MIDGTVVLVLPVEVEVAALVSVTVAALVLARDWPRVHARSAGRLVASTRFGVPVGLVVLTSVAPPVVEALSGARSSRSPCIRWRATGSGASATTGWPGCSGSAPACSAGHTPSTARRW